MSSLEVNIKITKIDGCIEIHAEGSMPTLDMMRGVGKLHVSLMEKFSREMSNSAEVLKLLGEVLPDNEVFMDEVLKVVMAGKERTAKMKKGATS